MKTYKLSDEDYAVNNLSGLYRYDSPRLETMHSTRRVVAGATLVERSDFLRIEAEYFRLARLRPYNRRCHRLSYEIEPRTSLVLNVHGGIGKS